VIDRLRGLIGAVSFHRGLALGALVGSAIAGSTIWARIRKGRRPTAPNGPDSDGAGTTLRDTPAEAPGSATSSD
jgi:hypothetical protein